MCTIFYSMKDIKIVPIFNQAAPGIWTDFARIESTAPNMSDVATSKYAYEWTHYKQNFSFGAYDGADMVGFVRGHCGGMTSYVDGLFLLPDYRGQNIGLKLLRKAESIAAFNGRRIELISLGGAMGFYKHVGYRALPQVSSNRFEKILPARRGGIDVLPVFSTGRAFGRASKHLENLPKIEPHQPAFMYVDIEGRIQGLISDNATTVAQNGMAEYIKRQLVKNFENYKSMR